MRAAGAALRHACLRARGWGGTPHTGTQRGAAPRDTLAPPPPCSRTPSASKCALNIVTKSLAVDLGGEGVTATLLHPGWVRTGMTGGQGLIDVEVRVCCSPSKGGGGGAWRQQGDLRARMAAAAARPNAPPLPSPPPPLQESVSGMLRVLEDGRELQGRFYDYKGDEIPW